MNQTETEYLTSEYGEAQRSIQLEFDWLESALLDGPEDEDVCTECHGSNWVEDPDGNRQCAYCD
jgi:hypothetical protein